MGKQKKLYSLEDAALFQSYDGFVPFESLSIREDEEDYKFTAILYPDCQSYANGRTCEQILKIVEAWGWPEWAYILHDRDIKADGTLKKVHYHVLIKTSSPSRLGTIARQLGIPSNYVQRVKSYKAMAKYLLHDENIDKAKYLVDEVICSNSKLYLSYFGSASETEDAQKILEYIISSRCASYISLLDWCCTHDLYATCRRNASMFSNCIREMRCGRIIDEKVDR